MDALPVMSPSFLDPLRVLIEIGVFIGPLTQFVLIDGLF